MAFSSAKSFEQEFPFDQEVQRQLTVILSAAVRAPSTHNSQPWRFRVDTNRLFVYRDTSIALPFSDTKGRYAHISIGFLLHHIITLGSWLSMSPQLTLVFKDDCIAEISFSKASTRGVEIPAQVEAIFRRRNRRGLFKHISIPNEVLTEVVDIQNAPLPLPEIRVLTKETEIEVVAEATAINMRRVYADSSFRKEMSKWITPTGSRRRDGIPGYSLNQPLFRSWLLPLMVRFFNMGNVLASLNKNAIVSASAVFGFGASDDPSGWVLTGFAASSVVLALTSHGFDYSVFVASMERPDTRERVAAAFDLHQPLEFLFAAGKIAGSVNWMTPRLSVEQKTISI